MPLASPPSSARLPALVLLTMNLIGLGIAPLVVGALNHGPSSRFGNEAVRYSLLVTAAVSLWAVVHSLLAARTIREDPAARTGGIEHLEPRPI